MAIRSIEHFIPNGDGYHLSLFQTWDDERIAPDRRPVLIVPGYGMNSYIFSFHPRGESLEGSLVQGGFEVWRVDLRGQGRSVSVGGSNTFGLADLAATDLRAAVAAVVERSRTGSDRADVIGASLGGTIVFLHTALVPDHRVGAIVAMGTPVRWIDVHPVVRLAFASPSLVGLVHIKGTRKIAELALPHVLKRTPWLLSIYLNAGSTDLDALAEMVKTVEDPNRHVNREIAQWIRDRDLIVRGVNLSHAIRSLRMPLLCVLARGDGIVPPRTAELCFKTVASEDKALLEVGDADLAMAHADMFVSREASARVFEPIGRWLKERRSV